MAMAFIHGETYLIKKKILPKPLIKAQIAYQSTSCLERPKKI
jgi:hypothetical protein